MTSEFKEPGGTTPDVGTLIGPYRTGKPIGAGAMAHVVEAVDVRTGTSVALKVLSADLAARSDVVARFVREGRALEHLKHPNIVGIVDHGVTEDGDAWIAMELLRGGSLADLVRKEGKLSTRRAVQIALDVAHALSAVHAWGIVHRDVKPENVMIVVDPAAARETAKLIDFGVAKVTAAELGSYSVQHTQMGSMLGSTAFAPPEQLGGQTVDATADVFALAVTLYEALTGKLPFEGTTLQEHFKTKRAGRIIPLSAQLRGERPSERLGDLLQRSLSPDRLKRPQNGGDMAAELTIILAELSTSQRALPVAHASARAMRAGAAAAPHEAPEAPAAPAAFGSPAGAPIGSSGGRSFILALVLLGIVVGTGLAFALRALHVFGR